MNDNDINSIQETPKLLVHIRVKKKNVIYKTVVSNFYRVAEEPRLSCSMSSTPTQCNNILQI